MATTSTTQTRRPWRTVVRTLFQLGVGLAAAWGIVVEAAGLDQTVPWVAATLTLSAVVTRLMASPRIEEFLRHYVPWLAADKRQS